MVASARPTWRRHSSPASRPYCRLNDRKWSMSMKSSDSGSPSRRARRHSRSRVSRNCSWFATAVSESSLARRCNCICRDSASVVRCSRSCSRSWTRMARRPRETQAHAPNAEAAPSSTASNMTIPGSNRFVPPPASTNPACAFYSGPYSGPAGIIWNMTRFLVLPLTFAVALAACTPKTEAPAGTAAAPPKPLTSGIDPATFDKAVRPQDDMFRYVNGAWLAKTEIPADKASYGSFDMLFDKAQVDLRGIAEEATKASNKTAGSDAQKIGDFYSAYMDEARVQELGMKPLEPELAAIEALKTPTDLARYFAHAGKLN